MVNNLHMCCRSPGPQGGARSTDTGPAHEPAAGSLPAAESTQKQSWRTPTTFIWSYPITACVTNKTQTNIHTEERCYNEPLCWDTDHMGLFGGFGHSVTSLAVISKEPKKERLQSPTGYVTSWPIVSHQMPKLSYDCDQGCNSRRFSQYNNHSFRLNKRFIIISQNMMSDMKLDISLIYIYFLIALTGQNSIPYIIYNRLFLNHVIPQNWFTAGTLISKDHQSPFLFMCDFNFEQQLLVLLNTKML